MKFNINSLLKDKNVLYIVLFLAVTNFIGYFLVRDFDAVIFFLIVGFLTTYFSKNMIVVMLVAMLSTNFLIGSRKLGGKIQEGMASKLATKKDKKIKKAGKENLDVPASAPAELDEEEAGDKNPRIDYAATLEQAYDNLNNVLGSDSMAKMGDDTQNLISQQQKLMESIKGMEPMMDKAEGMLNKLGGMGIDIEGLVSKMGGAGGGIEEMLGKLGKFGGKKDEDK